MKKFYIILGIIEAITAIGAVPAGLGYIMDTSGKAMGTTTAILENSPFSSFLIPGLFLLIVNGLGQATGAYLAFRRNALAAKFSIALGVILIFWIILQVNWIGLSHFLQPVFFITGILEAGTGYYILKEKVRII